MGMALAVAPRLLGDDSKFPPQPPEELVQAILAARAKQS